MLKTTSSKMSMTAQPLSAFHPASSNVKERVLTCTICLDLFKEPKILPCFHTFCKCCLWNHVMNTVKLQHFPCPLCRTNIHLPEGGVENFQSNFYVQEFTELIGRDSQDRVTGKKGWKEADVKIKTKNESSVSSDLYCPSHAYRKEWVVSFCMRCRVPICVQCKMHEHSGHEWQDLAVVVGEAQQQLQRLSTKVKRQHKALVELSEDRRRYMDGFTSHVSTVTTQIRTCAEDIKQKVDTRCDSLLSLLDHMKVTEASKVESHKSQVVSCLKSLAEVKQGMDHMMKGSGVLDLLASKTHIQEKVEDTLRVIPDFIEKVALVYDRKDAEGLMQRIESAMGYLSAERDSVEAERDINGGGDGEYQEPDPQPEVVTRTDDVHVRAEGGDIMRPPTSVSQHYPRTSSTLRIAKKSTFKPRSSNAGIRFIVPVPNMGTVIGYDSNPRYVDVVDDVGNRLRKYEAVATTSCALLLGQTNLVLCTSNPRQLSQKRLPQFSNIAYRTSDLPVTPTGICVKNHKELIICGKEKAGLGTGIYKYCIETKQINTIYANGDLHILKAPASVVVTQDGDSEMIVVSDPKRKSVFFFSMEGSLLYTFPSQRCSFCPEGLSRDMHGNVIVADRGNNSIIVLSPRGVFVQELIRGVRPRSLAFDTSGRLWLGETEGAITVYDYYG